MTLNDYHKAVDSIIAIEQRLMVISDAFCITGNSDMSDKLYDIKQDLSKQRAIIDSYVSESVRREFDTSQQYSKAILEVALGEHK